MSVKAPAGQFFIDSDGATPAVLIGGGMDMTPMISMLGWCLDQLPARCIDLYYGVRSSQDLAFKAQLEEQAAALAVRLDIQFRRSGRTLAWTGEDGNLLDFAQRHRLRVESGCRSGSCGTCDTALITGTVRYAHQPDYDVATGRCLLCVARPESVLGLEA